jgi:hypothetical protein
MALGLTMTAAPAMASTFGAPSPYVYGKGITTDDGTVKWYFYGSSNSNYSFRGDCQYSGTFRAHTYVMEVDWQADGTIDECFGIAPSRSIWHAWRNSGGWKQMPGGGSGDDTGDAWRLYGRRYVSVKVAGSGDWHSYYSNGAWVGWYRGGLCSFADC